ncbi:MAG: manganese transporter [Gemmatimonas sp.]|nr:manganese transporter [Gemmatimonas sp.]
MNWHHRALLPLFVAVALTGCAADQEGMADLANRQVRVVATTSIVADLAREVGGERVRVTGLMGPGVDPHLYRASEGDVRRMMEADIVLFNGLHLEGRMGELFEQMGSRGRPTVAVGNAIDPARLLTPPEFEGAYDPHIWMDAGLWRDVVGRVADSLADLDPQSAAGYRGRAAAYEARLEELDGYVRERIAGVPAELRVLVTAHDAFNYFGKAYDFDVRGLQGISTVAEAGTADVQELARFVAERRIPALFVETSVSPRSIEAVQAAVRARGFAVEVGGNLYSDALGGPGSGADTYDGMIRHNVDTIVEALLAKRE